MERLLNFIPFLLLSTDKGMHKINTMRLIEMLIAMLVLGSMMYIAIGKIEVKLEFIQRDIARLETKYDRLIDQSR